MSDQARSSGGLTLSALQRMILQMYGEKDAARGDAATFLWLTEEFGELATALRSGTRDELAAEMADVLAWLATLANIRGIELEEAVLRKYGQACPGLPCRSLRLRPGRETVTRPIRSVATRFVAGLICRSTRDSSLRARDLPSSTSTAGES